MYHKRESYTYNHWKFEGVAMNIPWCRQDSHLKEIWLATVYLFITSSLWLLTMVIHSIFTVISKMLKYVHCAYIFIQKVHQSITLLQGSPQDFNAWHYLKVTVSHCKKIRDSKDNIQRLTEQLTRTHKGTCKPNGCSCTHISPHTHKQTHTHTC